MAKTSPNDVLARYGNWYRGSDDLFAHCFVLRSVQSAFLFQGLQTVTLKLLHAPAAKHRQLAKLIRNPSPAHGPKRVTRATTS